MALAAGVGLGGTSGVRGEDLSEALRLWKFTYHMEIAAYGTQYMSKDLLQKASKQLDGAAGHTMITRSDMIVCVDATNQLSKYFRASAERASKSERKSIRAGYETARAGCLRLLGADPAEYPLGWPD